MLRAALMLLGVAIHVATSFIASPPADGAWPLREPNPAGPAGLAGTRDPRVRLPVFFVLSGFFGALFVSRRRSASGSATVRKSSD